MSWLFGKKKQQKDLAPESLDEEPTEEFETIPNWPGIPASSDQPSGNLYPVVPPVPEHGGLVAPIDDSSKDSNLGDGAHYLNGVPFKLCKRLENSMNSDLEIDQLRISEILSFIERVENRGYDYSFSLEESVIAEMNSRNDVAG